MRHGETLANQAGRLQGQSNLPLSERGREQARRTAGALQQEGGIQAIFASPLSRSAETAVIISEATGAPVWFDDDLMEVNLGIFQGLTMAEIAQRHPAEFACWRAREPHYRIPQGETREEFWNRAQRALERIVRQEDYHKVLVVSHGGTLSAGLSRLLGIPALRRLFFLDNCSLSRLRYEGPGELQVLSLNTTAHLGELETYYDDQ